MIDPDLQYFASLPLDNGARANRVWLPMGKLPPRRGARKVETAEIPGVPKLTGKELRERKKSADEKKLAQLFAYYAGTSLTAQQVADHVGVSLERATQELEARRK